MISFNTIPSNTKVPLAYIEFDNSKAVSGTPDMPYRVLFIGQKLAAGSDGGNILKHVPTADDAVSLYGSGSMLARMIQMFKSINRHIECWGICLSNAGAATSATGSIAVTGTATEAGTIALYIGGDRVLTAVSSGTTAVNAASAIAASINSDITLPVTASAVNGTVTVTARHPGAADGDIDIRSNYYSGDATPAGLATTITGMNGGANNPDISPAITTIGDQWFQAIVMPYTDSANMILLENELSSRWGGTRQIDGIVYCAYRNTQAVSVTFGDSRNSPFACCMATGITPCPPYLWAAAVAAQATLSLSIDPARPLQTLTLPGILPPPETSRWMQSERNILLSHGMSTWYVDSGGMVRIERLVTMYQKNAYGQPDPSYLDITTPATLSYLRYSMRTRITSKFPRHKLADDGVDYNPGMAIVTPKTIRAELIALAQEWAEAALIENMDQFKTDLVVERNANDRNRVDVLIPPDLVNQFMVFAAQIQFIL